MASRRQARWSAAMGLIFATMLIFGCAGEQRYPGGGGQTTQDVVIDEYMLTTAGFIAYKPNDETPKTAALLSALPSGQISTFTGNGRVYHAYPDKFANTLYVGDQVAYDKYVSMAQSGKVCRRVDMPDSSGFWSCFNELQKGGAGPRPK